MLVQPDSSMPGHTVKRPADEQQAQNQSEGAHKRGKLDDSNMPQDKPRAQDPVAPPAHQLVIKEDTPNDTNMPKKELRRAAREV